MDLQQQINFVIQTYWYTLYKLINKMIIGDLVFIDMESGIQEIGIIISKVKMPKIENTNKEILKNLESYKVLVNNNVVKFFNFRLKKI